MRHLAIDYGTKRIGLAMSDAGGRLSEAYDVVATNAEAVARLARVCGEEGVQKLVVGLPLNMDGTASWMTREAAAFGAKLAEATGLPTVYVDERLSSFEAEEELKDRKRRGEKLTRQDKKSRLDALAAAQFLREFLEGRLAPMTPPATSPPPGRGPAK